MPRKKKVDWRKEIVGRSIVRVEDDDPYDESMTLHLDDGSELRFGTTIRMCHNDRWTEITVSYEKPFYAKE